MPSRSPHHCPALAHHLPAWLSEAEYSRSMMRTAMGEGRSSHAFTASPLKGIGTSCKIYQIFHRISTVERWPREPRSLTQAGTRACEMSSAGRCPPAAACEQHTANRLQHSIAPRGPQHPPLHTHRRLAVWGFRSWPATAWPHCTLEAFHIPLPPHPCLHPWRTQKHTCVCVERGPRVRGRGWAHRGVADLGRGLVAMAAAKRPAASRRCADCTDVSMGGGGRPSHPKRPPPKPQPSPLPHRQARPPPQRRGRRPQERHSGARARHPLRGRRHGKARRR